MKHFVQLVIVFACVFIIGLTIFMWGTGTHSPALQGLVFFGAAVVMGGSLYNQVQKPKDEPGVVTKMALYLVATLVCIGVGLWMILT